MIKLNFLKLCRIKSIKSIKIFFSFILKLFIKKKDNMTQDISTVKNEKKKEEKGKEKKEID